jgi:hypothetical protein
MIEAIHIVNACVYVCVYVCVRTDACAHGH